MRYKIFKKLVNHSFQELMIHRSTAVFTVVFGLIFFSLEMIAGLVFFEETNQIFGWTRQDYLLLIATASVISFLYQTVFIASHEHLTEVILEGELDYVLLRPVPSLLYFLVYRLDIPSLINLLVSFGVQLYLLQFYSVHFFTFLVFLLAILLAAYFLFLLNQLAVSVSFWKENARSVLGVPEYLTDFASRPFVIYPNGIRFFFTWVVPILIGMNLPVLIVKQEPYMPHLLFLLLMDVLGTILVFFIWKKGLQRYASAN